MGQQRNSLSDSECDGVVAFTVLAILLRRSHPEVVEEIRREAMTQLADDGDGDVIAEAKEFFARALHQR